MAKFLNEKIGETAYDGLIVDNFPPADVYSVTIAAGEGKLSRGSVLAMTLADGKMKLISAESDGTAEANCILADDVDATSEATALAYRTGHFATNKLITKSEYKLTYKDKEALRKGGILLSDAL